MPLVKGNWQQSTRDYDCAKDAARALVFDLAFYTDYRNTQIQNLFIMSGMNGTLTKTEIDDTIETAYTKQNGRSYPTTS